MSASTRPTNKRGNIYPVLVDKYTDEVKIALTGNKKFALQFSKATKECLWELQWEHNIKYAINDICEIAIPFDDLNIPSGETFDFFCLIGVNGITEEVYPKDVPLTLKRP